MLLTDEEVEARVSSSGNLLNRLGLNIDKLAIRTVNRDAIRILAVPNELNNRNVIDIPSLPAKSDSNQDSPQTAETQSIQTSTSKELSIDDLIEDYQTKVQVGHAYSKAVNVLNRSLDQLGTRLDEAESPNDLATIIDKVNRVVVGINKKHSEEDAIKPQIIIFKPMMININDLNVVSIGD
jgi:uncharacterized iron-regulated protein